MKLRAFSISHGSALLCAVFPLIIGCHKRGGSEVATHLRLDRFRIFARSALVSNSVDSVGVRVVVINGSGDARTINFSRCETSPVTISVQSANRTWDSHVWEQSKRPVYHDSDGRVLPTTWLCSSLILSGEIPPEGSIVFDRWIPVRDILGDSLQSGRYKITAQLHINDQEVNNLHAGELDLIRLQQPALD